MKSELPVSVIYNNVIFNCEFRIDILVENSVIVELKSVKELESVHFKQVLTYLKLADKRLGILVNFNTDNILDSIKRIANKLEN